MSRAPSLAGFDGLTRDDADRVHAYVAKTTAASAQRAYASDWRLFTAWCDARRLQALPADPPTVAAFVSAEADEGVARATLGRRLAAIAYAHRIAG